MQKNIYYWSPFLTNIATAKAVINSAMGLKKYSKEYNCTIINSIGEFNSYKNEIIKNNINLNNFFSINFKKFLPKLGFLSSRISYIFIFLISVLPLLNIIKKKKPDFLIIHLLTSLPLTLLLFERYDTKFILRISGYPKINFIRYLFWKLASKRIYRITCPTRETYNLILKKNIIDKKKLFILRDPIINITDISKKKKERIKFKNFIFSAGRLTFQKNFDFLINCFNKINNNTNLKLVIAGDGEKRNELLKLINKLNLQNKVYLIGHTKNIFKYMSKCNCFILTSLWEDPGFVLLEAAACRALVISSNCKSGPIEIIKNKTTGYSFRSNDFNDFISKYNNYLNEDNKNLEKIKLNNLKQSSLYSTFKHSKELIKIIN